MYTSLTSLTSPFAKVVYVMVSNLSSRLQEETLVGDADVEGRLVVVLASELAQVVLCFHADLLDGVVVDTASEDLSLGVLLGGVVEIRVVILVVTEDIQFLVIGTQLLYL